MIGIMITAFARMDTAGADGHRPVNTRFFALELPTRERKGVVARVGGQVDQGAWRKAGRRTRSRCG